MNAIVFGGSGFVGSHVADALSEAGHAVTVFDSGPSEWLRSDQEFVLGDIREAGAVSAATDGKDAVYNFAGIADLDEARARPVDTVAVNVLGNANLLEAARSAGAKRYVFASTVYVGGVAGSFYRASKQACEAYIEEYEREYGLPYTILRYGTLYGRRAGETNSVHRYLRQALAERKVTAFGTGDEIREYIHVEDAARLSVEILAEEFANQQVVLTGDRDLRFRDLLTLIREVVGSDVEIDLRAPEGDTAHYAITPYTFRRTVARKLVGRTYTDLGQGLVDCLQEIEDQKQVEA